MIHVTDMLRGSRTSSRKRFFEQHTFEDNDIVEDEHTLEIERTSYDDVNLIGINVQ